MIKATIYTEKTGDYSKEFDDEIQLLQELKQNFLWVEMDKNKSRLIPLHQIVLINYEVTP